MRLDLEKIHVAARRERALAMHRLIFAPIAAFFRRPQIEVKKENRSFGNGVASYVPTENAIV